MARFKNIKLGKQEGIGAADVELGFGEGTSTAFKESFFGATSAGQDVVATETVNKYLEEVTEATGENLDSISRSALVGSIREAREGPLTKIGDGLFGNPFESSLQDFDAKIKELHAKDPSKFKFKGLADLKEEYLQNKDAEFAGEGRERGLGATVTGSISGFLADPINAITMAAPIAKAGLGVRTLFSMIGEGIVQSKVDQSAEIKALSIAGAGIGPAALKILGITGKAAKKLVTKEVNKILQKSGSLNSNLTKSLDELAESITDPAKKAALQSEVKLLKNFKGTTKEALENLNVAKESFESYKPFKSTRIPSNSKAKFVKNKEGKWIPAKEDALNKRIATGKVEGEALDELNLGVQRPVATGFDTRIETSTGKYSTYFDVKTGKPAVFKSSTDAERAVKALEKSGIDTSELKVGPTPKGEFAIVQPSDVSIIPKVKDFASAKEATAFAPKLAKKLGMDVEDIKAIKVGNTYKLATHASEGDVLSAEKGILNSFDEGGAKIKETVSEASEEALPSATKATTVADSAIVDDSVYARQLDQIMADDSIQYKVPGHESKGAFKKFIDNSKAAAKEFADCIGG